MTTHEPTVFVLDDDPAIRDSLSFLLQVMDVPAELFSTVSEFLDVYDPSRPGCLLLDIRLPGDGLKLLTTLAESDNSPPVIVITGHGDSEMRDTAIKSGAVAFFAKPFNVRELCKCIGQVLELNTRTT